MDIKAYRTIRDASSGSIECDLVINNAVILDVFSKEWFKGDIAMKDGVIVALGDRPSKHKIDAGGKYVTPGLIDAHLHIESTLVTPDTLNDILLAHGVTSIITDPHEIANVAGTDGIRYMVSAAKELELDIFTMLPSCVPSTPLENAGAKLTASKLAPLYALDNVLGLAEVMDSPAVERSEDMLKKLFDALTKGVPIDGHGATLNTAGLTFTLP